MASSAQIKANRKNSKKSTGPISNKGKAVASQNAIKHSILAQKPLLSTEDQADFAQLINDLSEELRPGDTVERELIDRLAMTIWRQRRLRLAERATLELAMNPDLVLDELSKLLRLDQDAKLTIEDLEKVITLDPKNKTHL